jgi:hypothetical protein
MLALGLKWEGELGDIGERVALTALGSLVVRSFSMLRLGLSGPSECFLESDLRGFSSLAACTALAVRFRVVASSARILRILMASFPKLKKEKKY